MRADRLVRMTRANLGKQHAVTLKLDGAVKAYEAAKALKKTRRHLKLQATRKATTKVAKAVQGQAKASGHLKLSRRSS